MRSPYFRERIYKKQINHFIITNEINHLIDPEIFQLILEYIYSNKCPWLSFSQKVKTRNEHEYQAYLIRMKNMEDDIDDHRYFARVRQQTVTNFGANQQQQHGTKSKKKKKAGLLSFFLFLKMNFLVKVKLHQQMNALLVNNRVKKN
jgi:hypothetical protein